MNDHEPMAAIANLLGDPVRAAMVWTLIDGTSRPAGELAFAANVSPQSASAHLAKLVSGGLLLCQAQGRHRYYRLFSAEAAHVVEAMASLGAGIQTPKPAHSLPRTPPPGPLVRRMPSQFLHARTCYDHLAGIMAVDVMKAMLDKAWLTVGGGGPEGSSPDLAVTPLGLDALAAMGVKLHGAGGGAATGAVHGKRALARGCVDLTQRRPHLAGVLGAALLDHYVQEKWILRTPQSRIVSITPKGQRAFQQVFGITL
jgi:DNA-binding transcriptional ArsR family regulator